MSRLSCTSMWKSGRWALLIMHLPSHCVLQIFHGTSKIKCLVTGGMPKLFSYYKHVKIFLHFYSPLKYKLKFHKEVMFFFCCWKIWISIINGILYVSRWSLIQTKVCLLPKTQELYIRTVLKETVPIGETCQHIPCILFFIF